MDPAVAGDNGDCSCFSWLWGKKKDGGVEELGDEMDETLIIEEQVGEEEEEVLERAILRAEFGYFCSLRSPILPQQPRMDIV